MPRIDQTPPVSRSIVISVPKPAQQAGSTTKQPQFVYNAALNSFTQVDPGAEQRGRDAINRFFDKVDAYLSPSPPRR